MRKRNPSKYRPKLRRPKPGEERYQEPPGLEILPSDVTILDYVYRARCISSNQLYALVRGNEEKLKRRLQLLWLNKFLERPPDQKVLRIREGCRYLIYSLGDRGANILAERRGYDIENIRWAQRSQVKFPFIKHALFITQFFTCLTLALREEPKLELIRWKQGREIQDRLDEIPEYLSSKQVRTDKPLIQPDALFVIHYIKGSKRQFFFLEADRGTVRERTMLTRYKKYWAYWEQGGFVEQGIPKELGFRVLTVSTNPTRAENLRQLIKQNAPWDGGTTMFWFTWEQWDIDNPKPILRKCWKTAKDEQLHSIID